MDIVLDPRFNKLTVLSTENRSYLKHMKLIVPAGGVLFLPSDYRIFPVVNTSEIKVIKLSVYDFKPKPLIKFAIDDPFVYANFVEGSKVCLKDNVFQICRN